MRATILPPSPEAIARAADALRRGEVVGMPTETVYGLAGSALDPGALARIFDTKERPAFDPLIVHVAPAAEGALPTLAGLEAQRLVAPGALSAAARARAETLIARFWPGPLTLVLPKHAGVPELATSGLPAVALRMPAHPVAQALIRAAGVPLAAPSANRFGRISPTTARAVADELGDRIGLILDGGPCGIGVESTVIRVEADGALTQLRPGGLSRARIEEAAGLEVALAASSSRPGSAPGAQAAPGMLESHYAPSKPMILLPAYVAALQARHLEEIASRVGSARHLGLLLQRGDAEHVAGELLQHLLERGGLAHRPLVTAATLSAEGDLHEAARNLFARMRELDASGAEVILAEPCSSDRGLGHAIADRLGRACRSQVG